MKINVTFRHMENDDQLKAYLVEKIEKISEKYLHRPQDATAVLTAEKFRRSAEIAIKADNTLLNAKEETEDLRTAIDLALDKLESQAKKHREKYKPKRKGTEIAAETDAAAPLDDEDFSPQVILDHTFVAKPMSIEDAIIDLEEGTLNFIVFRNSKNLRVCVLHRRSDRNYGLIEPED